MGAGLIWACGLQVRAPGTSPRARKYLGVLVKCGLRFCRSEGPDSACLTTPQVLPPQFLQYTLNNEAQGRCFGVARSSPKQAVLSSRKVTLFRKKDSVWASLNTSLLSAYVFRQRESKQEVEERTAWVSSPRRHQGQALGFQNTALCPLCLQHLLFMEIDAEFSAPASDKAFTLQFSCLNKLG